mmetsp:Transcript_81913/g.222346  ORF Transcript_81913/g.222346 Transcript_81913/m.222346 type:complete len:485 (+) Transcript_81913:23-1477(+)
MWIVRLSDVDAGRFCLHYTAQFGGAWPLRFRLRCISLWTCLASMPEVYYIGEQEGGDNASSCKFTRLAEQLRRVWNGPFSDSLSDGGAPLWRSLQDIRLAASVGFSPLEIPPPPSHPLLLRHRVREPARMPAGKGEDKVRPKRGACFSSSESPPVFVAGLEVSIVTENSAVRTCSQASVTPSVICERVVDNARALPCNAHLWQVEVDDDRHDSSKKRHSSPSLHQAPQEFTPASPSTPPSRSRSWGQRGVQREHGMPSASDSAHYCLDARNQDVRESVSLDDTQELTMTSRSLHSGRQHGPDGTPTLQQPPCEQNGPQQSVEFQLSSGFDDCCVLGMKTQRLAATLLEGRCAVAGFKASQLKVSTQCSANTTPAELALLEGGTHHDYHYHRLDAHHGHSDVRVAQPPQAAGVMQRERLADVVRGLRGVLEQCRRADDSAVHPAVVTSSNSTRVVDSASVTSTEDCSGLDASAAPQNSRCTVEVC